MASKKNKSILFQVSKRLWRREVNLVRDRGPHAGWCGWLLGMALCVLGLAMPAQADLTGVVEPTPLSVDLTQEGALDWWFAAHNGGAITRKAGTPVLGELLPYNGAVFRSHNTGTEPNRPKFSWTNGSPTASVTGTGWVSYVDATNRGYQWSVPVTTSVRRVRVYLSGWNTSGEFSASLSDGSAVPYVTTLTTPANTVQDWVITLDVSAATAGQRLDMVYRRTSTTGNIGLSATTLQDGAAAGSNNAPQLTSPGNQSHPEGESINLLISASDADGDILTYSATGLPPQLSLDAGTGQISGTATAAGSYNVTVSVDDNAGGSDSVSFAWVITSAVGARLTGVVEPTPLNVALSSEGELDWWFAAHNGGAITRKAGTPVLGELLPYNGAVFRSHNTGTEPNRPKFSWTNGSPTASVTGTGWVSYVDATNRGYQWSVPVTTSVRRVRVYLSGWNTSGEFSASLSDGSAVPYVTTLTTPANTVQDWVITLDVSAATAGQRLDMVYRRTSTTGNIGLSATTLRSSAGSGTLGGGGSAGSGSLPNQAPQANSGSISVDANGVVSGQLTASDAEGQPLSYQLVSPPSQGTVLLTASSGAFSYAPRLGVSGNDRFTFKVNDGALDSAPASLSISIRPLPQNQAPSAVNKSISVPARLFYDSQYFNNPLVGSDPDGDALTFHIVRHPRQGRVILPNPERGHFIYVNTQGVAGGDQFTYLVTDAKGGRSQPATVNVNITAAQRVAVTGTLTQLTVVGGQIPVNGSFTLSDGRTITGRVNAEGDFDRDGNHDVLFFTDDGLTYLIFGTARNFGFPPPTHLQVGANRAILLSSPQTGGLSPHVTRLTVWDDDDRGDNVELTLTGSGQGVFFRVDRSGAVTLESSPLTNLPTVSGSSEGQYSVGEDGQASYTLPIFTPPGQGGMQPSLVFNLSTMGGGTFMGLGGGLGGLSAITRCSRTLATDGVAGGVNFDSNDRFCLEGQRLVLVSGAYGADGAEYRTELDNFTRVISRSSAGSGPAWFEVRTKSGNRMFYGNTSDSRIEAQGQASASVWAVNKIIDAANNEINVSYHEDTATGEYYPLNVSYAPTNRVEFLYEPRADVFSGFQSGSRVSSSVLLRAVRVSHGAGLVREYRLSYNVSPSTRRTRLASLQECSNTQCYRPTSLGWDSGALSLTSTTALTGLESNASFVRYELVDINHDGFDDILERRDAGGDFVISTDRLAYYLSRGDGSFAVRTEFATNTRARVIGDVNRDGKPEIVLQQGGGSIMLSTPTGFAPAQSFNLGGAAVSMNIDASVFLDLNGDGLMDFVTSNGRSTSESGIAFIANGNGSFSRAPAWDILFFRSDRLGVADLNGDGLDDIYRIGSGGTADTKAIHLWRNTGPNPNFSQGFVEAIWLTFPGDGVDGNLYQLQEMNGDGLLDVVYADSLKPTSRVWFSTGKGFVRQPDWRGFPSQLANLIFTDHNGDGRADVLVLANNRFEVYLSTGSNFAATPVFWGSTLGADIRSVKFGDINADGMTDLFLHPSGQASGSLRFTRPSAIPDRLVSIANGYDAWIRFNYGLLSDPTLHTPDTGAVFPVADLRAPMRVIASTQASDGLGGWHETRYRYVGAKAHAQGRGFLGFRQIQTFEDVHVDGSESLTTTTYSQSFPHTGSVLSSETRVAGIKVAESSNTYAVHTAFSGVNYSYLQRTISHTWDTDAANSLVDSTTTTNVYDAYGNPSQITVTTTGDGASHSVVTQNVYDYSAARLSAWQLDRLRQSTVTTSYTGMANVVRVSDFDYYPNGLLRMERVEPNGTNELRLTTDYVYDPHGNITSQTVTGWNGSASESRTTTTTYQLGTVPLLITNPLGHTESRRYDLALGVMESQTGPNGLTTDWHYDSFGRQLLESRPDGSSTQWQYGDCDNSVVTYCRHFVTTTASGAAPTTTYFDQLSRQIRETRTSFDGRLVHQDSQYNRLGQRARASQPYFAGATPHFTAFTYDLLGRVVHEIQPGFGANVEMKTKTLYEGRVQRIYTDINARNLQMKKVYDARGNVIEMYDYEGATAFKTQYRYDPIGNLIETLDADGNRSTVSYDRRDRKIAMSDPDMGAWTYGYNAFGELIRQTDAVGNGVTLAYDRLGRLIRRQEPEGTTTWAYDSAAGAGIGKLHRVSRTQDNYSQTVSYDSLGRSSQSHTVIDGKGDGIDSDDHYLVTTAYDAFSRVERMTYPTGLVSENHYNAHGYLERVSDGASGALYWQALATDAFGNVTRERFGNQVESVAVYDAKTGYLANISTGNGNIQQQSYVYDNLSNLTARTDSLTGTVESFSYDTLNRLTGMQSSRYGNKAYSYDRLGNITHKSDFGAQYVYAKVNAGPHAVTQVKRADGSVVADYRYDGNGRMTSGNGRSITWTSFNQPTRITRGSQFASFSYNPERERIVQRSSGARTVYLQGSGAHYEKETDINAANGNDGLTQHRHYIYGGNGLAAIYTLRSNLTRDTRYVHKDPLGSIDTLTNASGHVVERRSFDPYGQSRTPSCTTQVCREVIHVAASSSTHRGFTGHEHLEEVGLIHMNGRVYDPELGRFLSADPHIQEPMNPQNFNRYSYVNNNPLSYTDPSGFFFKKLFRGVGNLFKSIAGAIRSVFRAIRPYIRTIVAIAVAVYVPGLGGAFLSGVISSGGDLKQGIISAITAGAFGALHNLGTATLLQKAGKVIAHGTVGGLSTAASGGDFKDGFLSAAVTQGFSQAGGFEALGAKSPDRIGTLTRDITTVQRAHNAVVAAVAGGVGSVIGGGKFQSGAVTGAFSRLFNDLKVLEKLTPAESTEIPEGTDPYLDALQDIANKSAIAVDQSFPWLRNIPWLRGIFIHSEFAAQVKALGSDPRFPFDAEVSYREGRTQRYGYPGTVRADAIIGSRASPTYAIDLKTGSAFISQSDAKRYYRNLPPGTQLVQLRPRGG